MPGFKESAWVKPSPTLYLSTAGSTPLPASLQDHCEKMDGFLGPTRFAKGGLVAFCDFSTQQQATNAMISLQGLLEVDGGDGIRISYDKDDSAAKRQEKEEEKARNAAHSACSKYICAICGAFVVTLAKPLADLRKRGTDESHIAHEKKHVVELSACKGQVKRLQRAQGVEHQYRLNCEKCGAVVAYRPVPVGEETKFCYLLKDSVVPAGEKAGTKEESAHRTGAEAHEEAEGGEGVSKRPRD